jgi:uncharacterized protein
MAPMFSRASPLTGPMIHPAAVLRPVDSFIGHGVFTTEPIAAGTVTWVRDPFDQTIAPAVLPTLSPTLQAQLRRYAYQDLQGNFVLCWDHARFNNHSCAPACRTVGDFDIAVRDIPAGAELTIDYAAINVPETLICACGNATCRGRIEPCDVEHCGAQWDHEVAVAARLCASVAQPLAELFGGSAVLMQLMADLQTGREPMLPSSRDLVLPTARVR